MREEPFVGTKCLSIWNKVHLVHFITVNKLIHLRQYRSIDGIVVGTSSYHQCQIANSCHHNWTMNEQENYTFKWLWNVYTFAHLPILVENRTSFDIISMKILSEISDTYNIRRFCQLMFAYGNYTFDEITEAILKKGINMHHAWSKMRILKECILLQNCPHFDVVTFRTN